MLKINLTPDEHIQHGSILYNVHEMVSCELYFFTNQLGNRHFIVLALRRSIKALIEACDVGSHMFFDENSEDENSENVTPSPYTRNGRWKSIKRE